MVKEDIFGGIKNAMARGASLKDAMQSFYNAGYPKEDIEQAARDVLAERNQNNSINQQPQQNQPIQPKSKSPLPNSYQPQQDQQAHNTYQNQQQPLRTEFKKESSKTGWIVFFVVLLLIIIGAAIALIVFRDQIIEKINQLA